MSESTLKRTERIAELLAIARRSTGSRTPSRPATAIARALLWEPEQLESRQINLHSVRSVVRANVGGQVVAVFAYEDQLAAKQLVNNVALYAYQASIEWGIVGNKESLTIFNSHRVRRGSWFELPAIAWDRVGSALDLFDALTQRGLTYGEIDRVAARFPEPDELLAPVDDVLVSKLDTWRGEIARYPSDAKHSDELIHQLFAQFFVLRAVEDRKLSRGLKSLLDCIKSTVVNRGALKQIFAFARHHLQSELFKVDITNEIPDSVLVGLIDDLYFARHLPTEGARYNFAWIDADVLGRAYEKYLSQILQSGSRRPQLELLQKQQPIREIDRLAKRRDFGVYYTPQFLVSYLVRECLDQQMSTDSRTIPRIVDPSCGSGSFLTASVDYLIRRLGAAEPSKNWGREFVRKRLICGIDSDPRAVFLARLSLWLRLAQEPNPLPLPKLDEVVIQGDSLSADTWKDLPSGFNIVLGNPPFAPTSAITSRTELETEFETARGRFDYAYLFVEQGVKKLQPNGHLAMVVPNRLFRNRDAGPARRYLSDNTTLKVVTDFESNEVFKGVSAYIGTVIAAKRRVDLDENTVRFTRVLSISDRLMDLMLSEAAHKEIANKFVQSFDIQHPTGPGPWLFLSPATRSARVRLEDRSVLLSELADVFQGIKAGANDIFIVQIESGPTAGIVSARNGLGDLHMIESALLHPVVYGAQIEAYKRLAPSSYIIYPYSDGLVVDERQLRSTYPLTYRYFETYRSLLESRTSIIASNRKWFELVRHREQSELEKPKLLMRDLAITTAFALDDIGATFLVGGTAVVPNDTTTLAPLLAYLNSVLVNWYLGPMTPWFKSEFQKFEPQHLSNIPVLRDVVEDEDIQRRLSEWVSEALEAQETGNAGQYNRMRLAIDNLLCSIIGVDPRG